jgi:hypothetical protein
MANAQYWREQVAQLHRAAWSSRRRYRRRLPKERLLRLRLRNDSAHRLQSLRHAERVDADELRARLANDSVGSANGAAMRLTAGTPRSRSSW